LTQHVIGTPLNQISFSSLEDSSSGDNPIQFKRSIKDYFLFIVKVAWLIILNLMSLIEVNLSILFSFSVKIDAGL
jgi:hypothetical protein